MRRIVLARLAGLCTAGAMVSLTNAALAVEQGKVSRTALSACFYRAIGAQDPDPKTRNSDHLAGKFLGGEIDFAKAMKKIRRRPGSAYFFVNARTKHIDAILEQELKNGAGQVVILGAGLDSRAIRFHERYPKVKFFELDLPATQNYKRGLLEKAVGPPPDTLIFAPIDFNTQTLEQVLAAAGLDKSAKTFFIWEGVSYYLNAEAVDGTLRFIAANAAPGSSVVFDYALEEVINSDFRSNPRARMFMRWLSALGEPWVFGIAADKAGEYVARCGLRAVSDLDAKELTKRYLTTSQGEPSGRIAAIVRIMHAAVPKK